MIGKLKFTNIVERIEDSQNNKIVMAVFAFILAFSSAFFSVQQIINYSIDKVIITGSVAFVVGLLCGIRLYEDFKRFIVENKIYSIVIFIICLFVAHLEYQTKGAIFINDEAINGILTTIFYRLAYTFNFFRLRYYVFSSVAIWCIAVLALQYVAEIVKDVFAGISEKEIKLYKIISFTLMAIVLIVYILNSAWYLQYDNVYSIDSKYCYNNIYPDLNYFDMRHPLMSELAFPIWSVSTYILRLLAPENMILVLTAVLIQWINIQMLMLVGMMIRKLTGKKIVFYIYMCSFSSLLFFIAFEKYQLCVFLLVLYVYSKLRKKIGAAILYILTAGTMPTNGVIGLIELFVGGSIRDRIKKIVEIIICGIISLICLGRVLMLNISETYTQIEELHDKFGAGKLLSVSEKTRAVINMIASCFYAISSEAGKSYLWQSVTTAVPKVAMLIMAIICIGIYVGRKEKIYNICTGWLIFAFALFVGLNWAPHESPLFAILFSWAIIPLFVKGMEFVFEKLKIKKRLGYGLLLLSMLSINIATLMDINTFLKNIF